MTCKGWRWLATLIAIGVGAVVVLLMGRRPATWIRGQRARQKGAAEVDALLDEANAAGDAKQAEVQAELDALPDARVVGDPRVESAAIDTIAAARAAGAEVRDRLLRDLGLSGVATRGDARRAGDQDSGGD